MFHIPAHKNVDHPAGQVLRQYIEPASYGQRHEEILSDPAASFWLKLALIELSRRDPLDAQRDAGILYQLAVQRTNEVLGAYRAPGVIAEEKDREARVAGRP